MFKSLLGAIAVVLLIYEVIAVAIGAGMLKAAIRTHTAAKVTFPVWPLIVGVLAGVGWIIL